MFLPTIAARFYLFRRALHSARFALSLLFFIFSLTAVRAEIGQAQLLAFETTIRMDLPGDQTHRYEIPLEAGQFIQLQFKQQNTDVSIKIFAPTGEQLIGMRTTEVCLLARTSGQYLLEIRARDKTMMKGRYELSATRPRPAGEREETQAAADRAMNEAAALMVQERSSSIRAGIEKLKTAASLYHEAERPVGEAAALYQAGNAYLDLPRGVQASRELLNQSLALARSIKARSTEAAALNRLGISYFRAGDEEKAFPYYEQALPLFKELNEGLAVISVTYNLALAYYQHDELQKSLTHFDEALSLAEAMGDRRQQAYILNNLGFAVKDMGDLPKSLDHLKKALTLLDGPGTRRFEAKVHNNIGIAYKEIGDYTKALDAYQRSLSISRDLEDKIAEPQLLNNIGNIYKAENENQKSIEYYDQALALFKEQKNPTGEALALNNIGSAYYQMGEYQKALDHNLLSLEIRRSRGEIRWEASSLYHAGRALWKLGQKEKAIESFSQSLEIRRRYSDPIGEADALLGLAGVRREMGELDEARTQIESALKLTEGIRSRLAGGDLRASYIARVQETYEFYIGLLMEMHRRSPSAGYDVQALVAAERTRARVLVESLAEARVDLRQGVDAETLKQERTTQKQLSDASAELSRLLASASAETNVAAARARLEKLSIAYQQIQSQIRQNSPRYAALTQPESLKLGEIQALLDENSVVLEYALGEERSFLWAVTQTSVNSFELPGRDRIGALTGSLYGQWTVRQPKAGDSQVAREQRVAAADANALREAAALSQMLLGPVATRLKNEWAGKRLLVVAAGALEYLPFAALPAPDTSASLIADHEIVNLPSVSSLAVLRSGTAERQPAPKVVAVLADPVFEKNDPRLSMAAARKPAQDALALKVRSAAAVSASPSWASVRGDVDGGSLNARRGLSRLPFSREEADAITAMAPASARLKATDFSASLAVVMGGELENYRIVHFATHGLVDSEHPELSGLVLSLMDENGNPQDGFLRMAEIYNLRLKADLVVLSACQTGLGKQIKGEGLVGLTRGFMYAGAPRVVASLWQVDDMATAELMKRFYRGVLKDGARPAAALRAAQLEMMRQKRWAAPYYWAAFVLQGEWK